MTKTKIAIYLALIFLAGAVAGGAAVRSLWTPKPPARRGPPPSPEEFANRIFNEMKQRLELTPEQVEKVGPVFRKGFEEVRSIQDRSVKEVQAAVRRNHAEIGALITPEQKQKLEEWDRDREKFFREHHGGKGHRVSALGVPSSGSGPGPGSGPPREQR